MLVRMVEAELDSFKNVEHGAVRFVNYSSVKKNATVEKPSIEGIYGQNGSGKTAMIEAMSILRLIMRGHPVSSKKYGGIISETGDTRLAFTFFVQGTKKKYLATYSVNLANPDESAEKTAYDVAEDEGKRLVPLQLRQERLTYYEYNGAWKGKHEVSVKNIYYDPEAILGVAGSDVITMPQDEAFQKSILKTDGKTLLLVSAQKGCSVFFNELLTEKQRIDDFSRLLKRLMSFANANFQIVPMSQLGIISLSALLPIIVRERDKNIVGYGQFFITPGEATLIRQEHLQHLKKSIDAMNIALGSLIPDLKIALREVDHSVETVDRKDPETGGMVSVEEHSVKVIMLSVRNGKAFSIQYESAGIQRLISILSYLIAIYNDPDVCLVVDELDDGIFEYLLGELVGVLGNDAKGQLIFTSHNLRVLEKLDYKNIICTTTNPRNRYIRLTGVSANHNKRDFYIRALVLGGQKEELYDADELDSIRYAFHKAYAAVDTEAAGKYKDIEQKIQRILKDED